MAQRRHRLLLIAVSIALVGSMAAVGCSSSSKSSAPSTTKSPATTAKSVNAGAVIAISEYMFNPMSVTIKAGQSIEWKNDGNVAHTVTETTSPHTFASADINPGQSYTQTFDKPGTYNYVCSIHPDRMQGTIVVTAS